MNKHISWISCIIATVLSCSVVFGGCTDNNSTEYTIQYTDNAGLHSLSVMSGSVYSLETLPQKYGYEFLGLFDAKIGGTQYTDENGSSLSAFTDNKNIVLFPQFKAKEYILILDYQGAAVTGNRSMTVSYDSIISELPMNLSLEYKDFTGWYTEPNRQGIQIADEYGVLPVNSKVTEKNFNFSDTDNNIYLYAGFENIKHTVTFYFEDNNSTEEIKVEHGTDIKNIVPETRINGNAVLTWSKIKNDTNKEYLFTGKITSDLALYATEYAPIIDFDESGGEKVIPIVARAGSSILLPTPIKENYKFIEWQDASGNTYTSTTMPTESIMLKAVWQAKLVFDENGGTEVTDISKAVGESITLPSPKKEGFIFAGWYTMEKEKYTTEAMPTESIVLKAGWYEGITITKTIIDGEYGAPISTGKIFSDYTNINKSITLTGAAGFKSGSIVKLTCTLYMLQTFTGSMDIYMDVYNRRVISEAYLLETKSFSDVSKVYTKYTFEIEVNVTDSLYFVFYGERGNGDIFSKMSIKDFYADITYPDTTTLYL